ncbi:thermonuclease family protein [Thermoflavimicrobium dichotomicum]|uniref:Endonuclease YncB, thermonuclease family n=1 Tax=Thermoflavimicrobium dichotomicum TaxID=46223 RepID=A0A1I3S1Q8_9BACL|nr:thermonuclease family protein [Thermoflavimicrobium dichotomicum]SFJ51456.1 Endonuclease YncB, thermonuclease family [Thermoflavimicrobium dichotomicum]
MKQWMVYVGILTSCLLLATSCHFEMNRKTAYVEKVIDGDTIHLTEPVMGTKKVRLVSVDAPETNYQGQAQHPWGEKAKNFLMDLLPAGTRIDLEWDQEAKDRYGRLLAHVWKGDTDVNKELIRHGHAVTYYIDPNMKYFEEYQSAYLRSKREGKGMWNPDQPISALPFEFRDQVSGQVQDKYVGNYDTRQYVPPDQYKSIPIEKRIFFLKEEDAKKAGYKKMDS